MSAERLRAAAQKIRTPARAIVEWRETGEPIAARRATAVEDQLQEAGFTEPDVALAVAAWLDDAYVYALEVGPVDRHAAAVAAHILGDDS